MNDCNCFRLPLARCILIQLVCIGGAMAADFQQDIGPILAQRCLTCHSTEKQKGELDLEQFSSLEAD